MRVAGALSGAIEKKHNSLQVKTESMEKEKPQHMNPTSEALEPESTTLEDEIIALQKWQKAFDIAPYPMAVYDFLKGYYYPNQAFAHVLNLDMSLKKTLITRELYSDPETGDQILDSIIAGDSWSGEAEMLKSNGESFYTSMQACPIQNDHGDIFCLLTLQLNFVENRVLKRQKELHSQYLQTLQSVTLGMIRRLDLARLLGVIITKACGLARLSGGFIFLYDAGQNNLVLKAGTGKYAAHTGSRVSPDLGIVGAVFSKKEPIITEDLAGLDNMAQPPFFSGTRGIIGLPLVSGSTLHGVIGMSDNEKPIDVQLLSILEEFSSIAAVAIDNTRLHEDLKESFQKRIEIEQKRQEDERRAKEQIEEKNEKLKEAYIDSIHRLVRASEFKDEDTGDHIVRLGEYSRVLAEKLGWPADQVETIKYAAPMHDIGKIGIPDNIMQKPGKLTDEEFDIIKTHTTIGSKILSKSDSQILKMAKEIALCHHEKYNGTGYPNGLKKEDIPEAARIVAVADTFDALTSKRPYKDPYPPEMVLDIIRNEKGKHFDPAIVDLFIEYFEEFLNIRETIGQLEEIDLNNFVVSERDLDTTTY
jgi:response regulator RpfG family c-di-GMP phosphodiesterase